MFYVCALIVDFLFWWLNIVALSRSRAHRPDIRQLPNTMKRQRSIFLLADNLIKADECVEGDRPPLWFCLSADRSVRDIKEREEQEPETAASPSVKQLSLRTIILTIFPIGRRTVCGKHCCHNIWHPKYCDSKGGPENRRIISECTPADRMNPVSGLDFSPSLFLFFSVLFLFKIEIRTVCLSWNPAETRHINICLLIATSPGCFCSPSFFYLQLGCHSQPLTIYMQQPNMHWPWQHLEDLQSYNSILLQQLSQ